MKRSVDLDKQPWRRLDLFLTLDGRLKEAGEGDIRGILTRMGVFGKGLALGVVGGILLEE
jgi:hypothetical protein